jgi:hypothetical protein
MSGVVRDWRGLAPDLTSTLTTGLGLDKLGEEAGVVLGLRGERRRKNKNSEVAENFRILACATGSPVTGVINLVATRSHLDKMREQPGQ